MATIRLHAQPLEIFPVLKRGLELITRARILLPTACQAPTAVRGATVLAQAPVDAAQAGVGGPARAEFIAATAAR